jgi:hypothetical protein
MEVYKSGFGQRFVFGEKLFPPSTSWRPAIYTDFAGGDFQPENNNTYGNVHKNQGTPCLLRRKQCKNSWD